MELYQELESKISQLDMAIKTLRTNGTKLAEAERDYKIALRTEILKLRDDGVAVGIIDKTCYGIPTIAALRYQRDLCDCVYKANLEAINSIKLQIRLLDNQLSREWGNVKNEL